MKPHTHLGFIFVIADRLVAFLRQFCKSLSSLSCPATAVCWVSLVFRWHLNRHFQMPWSYVFDPLLRGLHRASRWARGERLGSSRVCAGHVCVPLDAHKYVRFFQSTSWPYHFPAFSFKFLASPWSSPPGISTSGSCNIKSLLLIISGNCALDRGFPNEWVLSEVR